MTGGVWRTRNRAALTLALLALAMEIAALPLVASADAPAWDYVISVNSDYDVSGRVATLDVIPPWDTNDPVATVHSDADATYYEGLVYVVNHLYADNIQVLDPAQGFSTVGQFSTGPGSNPQHVSFLSPTRAYVTRHERTHLLDVDPSTGAVADSVDLSAFADADGLPEMSGMALRDGLLFVALQRLDRDYYWVPVAPSLVAVIDTATNTLVDADETTPGVQAIELPLTNPYREVHVDDASGLIYIACSGSWGALDGGIVEVDPVSLEVTDVVTTELQLGGEIYDFTLPLAGRAHAVVSTSSPSWEQFCVAFDWASGNKLENVWKPGGYSVMDVELHEGSGQLFLADRTYASPGVRVFDAVEGDQLTTGPLTASLPPHDLLVVGDQVASVEPQEAHRALSLSVWPNPMREGCSLSFFASAATTARVVIYDASGRVVRTVLDSAVPAGDVALPWDGLDRCGRPAAAGVYFVRVEAGEAEASTKVVLLR